MMWDWCSISTGLYIYTRTHIYIYIHLVLLVRRRTMRSLQVTKWITLASLSYSAIAQIKIPSNGPYSVSISTAKLTDPTRIDPWDPNNGTRSIMTSLFYPIPKSSCRKHCSTPYMSGLTASVVEQTAGLPNGTASAFQLDTCCKVSSRRPNPSTIPLVIFSHGLGSSRFLHSAQIQALAASGYAVLAIDHPYDAVVVEFPNDPPVYGTLAGKLATNPGLIPIGARLRAADVTFALNELSKRKVVSLFLPGATCAFNTKRATVFGHSYGGTTSILALTSDSRLIGGFDMDGAIQGFGESSRTKKPVILAGTSVHNSTTDSSWRTYWPRLEGYKREFDIQQTGHYVYTDAPVLVALAGLTPPPGLGSQLGELGSTRGRYVFDAIVSLLKDFMDFSFKGVESDLLKNPGTVFPEVVDVEHDSL